MIICRISLLFLATLRLCSFPSTAIMLVLMIRITSTTCSRRSSPGSLVCFLLTEYYTIEAEVVASTYEDFFLPFLKVFDDPVAGAAIKLPVLEREHGDTWVYGVASDPLKVFLDKKRLWT